MKRKDVKSSNIKSVGYDAMTQTLEIEFSNGVYHYKDVPRKIYRRLINAKSIGKCFHADIKPNYDCKKGEFEKMDMPNIYICGKAGAGKTYAAKYFMEKFGYCQAKFAHPVYAIARNYFGMQNKDRKLLQTIGTDAGRDTIDQDIWVNRFVQDTQIAKITSQLLGLPDVFFICDDCRFPNEHEVLKNSGWIGIYLDAPDDIRAERLKNRDGDAQISTLGHSSETSIDLFKDELIRIDSSKSLEETYAQLDNLIENIGA